MVKLVEVHTPSFETLPNMAEVTGAGNTKADSTELAGLNVSESGGHLAVVSDANSGDNDVIEEASTKRRLRELLDASGLGQHYAKLVQEGVDSLAVLSKVAKDDFVALGIDKLGDRIKLRDLILQSSPAVMVEVGSTGHKRLWKCGSDASLSELKLSVAHDLGLPSERISLAVVGGEGGEFGILGMLEGDSEL